jgi:hypothetical protein
MKGCGHSVDNEGHLLLNHRVAIYTLAGPALYIMAIHPGETGSWAMTSPDPLIQHGDNRQHGGQMKPTRYRICVHGQLTERLGSAFDGMSGVWSRKSR